MSRPPSESPEPDRSPDASARRAVPGPVLVAAALGLYLASGFFFVGTDQQAVVLLLGRVERERVLPGLHWRWPWPLSRVEKLRVEETRRLTVGFDAPDQILGRDTSPRAQFLTGDRNIINIRLVAQFRINDPVRYLFGFRDVEKMIANAVEESLATVVTRRRVDDLLTTGKVAVQQAVQERSQARLDEDGCGVSILGINLETIAPPEEVREAFNDVASAREDRDRIVREAQSYYNEVLPVARGEAARLLEEAASYQERVVQRAAGDAARFTQLAAEHRKVPRETDTRLYLETMEEVLPRMRKTIVDSEASTIDFDFLRREP